jgi:hypothetical protein
LGNGKVEETEENIRKLRAKTETSMSKNQLIYDRRYTGKLQKDGYQSSEAD